MRDMSPKGQRAGGPGVGEGFGSPFQAYMCCLGDGRRQLADWIRAGRMTC